MNSQKNYKAKMYTKIKTTKNKKVNLKNKKLNTNEKY
jgi:hypothetical protein